MERHKHSILYRTRTNFAKEGEEEDTHEYKSINKFDGRRSTL